MRHRPKTFTFWAIVVGFSVVATAMTVESAEGQREVTFRLTSLTQSPVHLQHGIRNYITLNMIETGGSKAISVKDPPPFPLTATLQYQTPEGQKRKVSSAYGYRC
jgi:hypothetical protein